MDGFYEDYRNMKKISGFQLPISKQIKSLKFKIKNSRRQTGGFTLLELVIAMAIMAVLAVGLWSNFSTSIVKGRDSRRKQDMENISRAIELYYQDNNAYPLEADFNVLWGQPFVNATDNTVIYMAKVPQDPSSPSRTYCYESDGNGSYFRLLARLENANDPSLLSTPRSCGGGGVTYNYAVHSSNVTAEP
jgi:general secretion pathway protein G